MRILYCILLFSFLALKSQDSSGFKIQLFSVDPTTAGAIFSKKVSFDDMLHFADNPAFGNARAESTNYSEVNSAAVFYDAADFGLKCSFKLSGGKKKIFRKIKPRLGLYYSSRTLINSGLNYYTQTSIDTIYYTDPKIPPIYIDSISRGYMRYTFLSEHILLEAGLNYDFLTFRYFNFYTGFLFGQSLGSWDQFSLVHQESYSVSPPPRYKQGTFQDYTLSEKSRGASISRITIPIGIEYRFRLKRNFSPGLLFEMRPGYEVFKKSHYKLSGFSLAIGLGLRLNFQKNK